MLRTPPGTPGVCPALPLLAEQTLGAPLAGLAHCGGIRGTPGVYPALRLFAEQALGAPCRRI